MLSRSLLTACTKIATSASNKRALSSSSIYDQQERIQEKDYKRNILDTMTEPKKPYKIQNKVIFIDPYRTDDGKIRTDIEYPHYQERYLGNYAQFHTLLDKNKR